MAGHEQSVSRRTLLALGGLALGGTAVAATALAAPIERRAERHPAIRGAIRALHDAADELKAAKHDYGGHRKEALEAVDRAVSQLETCLKFDRA